MIEFRGLGDGEANIPAKKTAGKWVFAVVAQDGGVQFRQFIKGNSNAEVVGLVFEEYCADERAGFWRRGLFWATQE